MSYRLGIPSLYAKIRFVDKTKKAMGEAGRHLANEKEGDQCVEDGKEQSAHCRKEDRSWNMNQKRLTELSAEKMFFKGKLLLSCADNLSVRRRYPSPFDMSASRPAEHRQTQGEPLFPKLQRNAPLFQVL